MCLSVPGKILEIFEHQESLPQARVGFGGVEKNIIIAYTPEAKPGDYVLVHVGFALKIINEDEAGRILRDLADIL